MSTFSPPKMTTGRSKVRSTTFGGMIVEVCAAPRCRPLRPCKQGALHGADRCGLASKARSTAPTARPRPAAAGRRRTTAALRPFASIRVHLRLVSSRSVFRKTATGLAKSRQQRFPPSVSLGRQERSSSGRRGSLKGNWLSPDSRTSLPLHPRTEY